MTALSDDRRGRGSRAGKHACREYRRSAGDPCVERASTQTDHRSATNRVANAHTEERVTVSSTTSVQLTRSRVLMRPELHRSARRPKTSRTHPARDAADYLSSGIRSHKRSGDKHRLLPEVSVANLLASVGTMWFLSSHTQHEVRCASIRAPSRSQTVGNFRN